MPEPVILHRCPHCGRWFDSPSECEDGTLTVPTPTLVPIQTARAMFPRPSDGPMGRPDTSTEGRVDDQGDDASRDLKAFMAGEPAWHVGRKPIPRGECRVIRGNWDKPDVHVQSLANGEVYSAQPGDLSREPLPAASGWKPFDPKPCPNCTSPAACLAAESACPGKEAR